MTDLTRQHQTVFGDKKGNCFATCIACLFQVPVDEVPNFCGDHWDGEDGEWFKALQDWLRPRGYTAVILTTSAEKWLTEATVIASGPGPRGADHAVLWRAGELLHDPHPSGDGLLELNDLTVLVPFDPARVEHDGRQTAFKDAKALKRQVNRLIAGNTIEGDEVPYPDEEC